MRDKTIKIVEWLVVGILLLLVAYTFWDYMFVDRCLDKGGSWNYRDFKCEMSEGNPKNSKGPG